jgi:hypothetical protein
MTSQSASTPRRAALVGGAAIGLLCIRAHAQHIIPLPADIPVPTTDGASAELWVSDASAILVTAHVPDPFELTLSMSATGSAEETGRVPTQTLIDSSQSFSNQDHTVWCVGGESWCSPPYNGSGYYGFRFTLADGVHFGWVSTFFLNRGFGSVVLTISAAAYDNRPDWPIPAGAVDPILPSCESVDFNCDGDVGTDADIDAFFACIAGACPASPCENTSDFNNDGDSGTDADIEAFFSVLAGNPCPPQ